MPIVGGKPCRNCGGTARYTNAGKPGQQGDCVRCTSRRAAAYQPRRNAVRRAWYERNKAVFNHKRRSSEKPQFVTAERRAVYAKHAKQQRDANPGFASSWAIWSILKRAHRVPSWSTKQDRVAMRSTYMESARLSRETGVQHVVDHEIPLYGKRVCGLHVPGNLRVITKRANQEKGNRLMEVEVVYVPPKESQQMGLF